ncbi:6-phosphogluconolactonase [Corynebacterium mayonis]|uniref:6-phosphogluconolactonase n=1 Tax=Corynebacterium mayonis TaxID=3062461 RepID=UPI0031405D69
MVTVSRHPDLASLVDAAATRFTNYMRSIHSDPHGGAGGNGIAHVVFTGGSAGIAVVSALADRDIDWKRVHVFFGDERNVAVNHPDSNEGQARQALLGRIDIPEANIHGYGLDGGDMQSHIADYEEAVKTIAPHGFDIHLLGMGGEGHINSLFPHSAALAEKQKLVVAVKDSPKPPAERATLTLPAVTRADEVWLLVSGAEKAEAAAQLSKGADVQDWPAVGAVGRRASVLFVTEDAAAEIS